MRRLRLLRILLPLALVLVVGLLFVALKDRPRVHRGVVGAPDDARRRAEGIQVVEYEGSEIVLEADAGVAEEDGEGRLRLEQIRRFLVFREEGDPLVVSALSGEVTGEVGRREMRFDREVVLRDPNHDLVAVVPGLEVDEAAGIARSVGGVRLDGSAVTGTASELRYFLNERPPELSEVSLRDAGGSVFTAGDAVLLDGLDDVEFRDEVRGESGEGRFESDRMRMRRWPNNAVRYIEAEGHAAGRWPGASGEVTRFGARWLEARADPDGELEQFVLRGEATVAQRFHSISASTIEGRRAAQPGSTWFVVADGTAYLRGPVAGGAAWLRAERIEATIDPDVGVLNGEATGPVRFDGPGTRAEAAGADFDFRSEPGEIRLHSDERRKARVARDRTRVAARRIRTDPGGQSMFAEQEVEATLLPAQERSAGGPIPGMFDADEAVHFVADQLDATEAGGRLLFTGGVRGWQGERNLAAEHVLLDHAKDSMSAWDELTTRFPRDGSLPALAESDYLQVSSSRLDYSDRTRLAVYTGEVRVWLAEGWIEAERLEVQLGDDGGGLRQVRAAGQVRIEFRDPEDGPTPRLISGTADRLVYDPADGTVHLFGDATPARVRRIGGDGGTTAGRALLYRLADGTLEVDSGEREPGRISTSTQ